MRLTHYTNDISAILGILSNGFAWVPNKRCLIPLLVPDHDFSEREPQQFGMVSFTDLAPKEAKKHRQEHGNYGIAVSEAWARSHKVQKVMYIDKTGPVIDALAAIFQIGHKDLTAKIRFPDDAGWQMAYPNKLMGGVVGSSLWANLLQLYEYLEPIEHAYQQEWRITQPLPYYSNPDSKDAIIKAVSPPRGWAQVLVVQVKPENILGFVCPTDDEQHMRNLLPDGFSSKKIVTV